MSAASTLWRTDADLTRSLAPPTLPATSLEPPDAAASSRPDTASATLPVSPAAASAAAATEAR